MATCNFEPMKHNFPLIVGGLDSYEEMREQFEKEFEGEFTEDTYYAELQYQCEDAEYLAKEFNKELDFYEVELRSGYYQGFQFCVIGKYDCPFDFDEDSEYCLDDEDADYYFNMTKKEVLENAKKEWDKVNAWLIDLKQHGYIQLGVLAKFDNGETMYTQL